MRFATSSRRGSVSFQSLRFHRTRIMISSKRRVRLSRWPYLLRDLHSFIMTEIEDFNTRIERIRAVIQALPRYNFDLLKRVVEHLDR